MLCCSLAVCIISNHFVGFHIVLFAREVVCLDEQVQNLYVELVHIF